MVVSRHYSSGVVAVAHGEGGGQGEGEADERR